MRFIKSTILYHLLIFLIIIIAFTFRLKNLNSPILDTHYFRQAQPATIAWNFYNSGIDSFQPQLDIFGEGKERVLIIEFPFFQSIVAFFAYLVGYSDALGKLISILFGLIGGIILLALISEITEKRLLAIFTFVFYLFFPLNIFFQHAYMIESTVVTLHIFSIFSWYKYAKAQNNIWYIIAIIITVLAFLQKSVYAPFLIPVILVIFYIYRRKKIKPLINLFIGLAIPSLCLVLWQIYVDKSNIAHGNSFFTSQNESQWLWNVGTLEDRLSLNAWVYRITNLIDGITKFALISFIFGLFALYKSSNKDRLVWIIWLLSMILYFCTFYRIQSHNYYSLPIMPIISIISAYGLYTITSLFHSILSKLRINGNFYIILPIFFLLLFSVKGYLNSLPFFSLDSNTRKNLDIIKSQITEKGNIIYIFSQKDWNSIFSYYHKRIAIVLTPDEINPSKLVDLKKGNYKYLVLYGLDKTSSSKINKTIKDLILKEDKDNIKIYIL